MTSDPDTGGFPIVPDVDGEESVRRARIRNLYENLSVAQPANVALLAGTVFVGLRITPAVRVVGWSAGVVAVLVLRHVLLRRWKASADRTHPRWERAHLGATLLLGIAWGLAPFLVFQGAPDPFLLFMGVVLTGVCGGCLATLGASAPATLAFVVPVTLGLALRFLTLPAPLGWTLAALGGLYTFLLWGAARSMERSFSEQSLIRRAAREARAGEARATRFLEDTLQHAPLLLSIYDAQDRLIHANEAYLSILPAPLNRSALGSTYSELLAASEGTTSLDFRCEADAQTYREGRIRSHRAPGGHQLLPVHGRIYRISDVRTSEGGILTLGVDVTGERDQQAALELALQAAREASLAKSRFLSHMSHELRTPLNAISGFTGLLQMQEPGPLNEGQLDCLRHVQAATNQLLTLIVEVLGMAEMEAAHAGLNRLPLSARAVAEEALGRARPAATRAGIGVLRASLQDQAFHSDPERIHRILAALLGNAILYNHPGGEVHLEVQAKADGHLRFAVRDTGPGIPAHLQSQVFEPFNRLGRESSAIPGAGLGLHLSQRLAATLEGRVGFVSEPGVGTQFWLDLPLGEPGAA